MIKILKTMDRWLLPDRECYSVGAYVWLVYLLMFYVSLFSYHPVPNSYSYAGIGTIVFLAIYFHAYQADSRQIKWHILAILSLGSLLALLSPGASVFFVYAGAFCCRLGSSKKAFAGIFFILLWIIILSWLLSFEGYFYIPAIVFSILVGGMNIYQHNINLKNKELLLSQQEVKHLARTSERERIARDLHDLIGHTFSVISLKAELAEKLIDNDTVKAKHEIQLLGNISREALKQIREVVTGYRTSDLNTELAHAKYVLESNDISFEYEFESGEVEIDDSINKELAIILKELVTNILKHSEATRVKAHISIENSKINLQVIDNGQGFKKQHRQGFGLKGINERVSKLSGKLSVFSENGVEFNIQVPLGDGA